MRYVAGMAELVMETVVRVRVRYVECDPMNVAHHSAYPVWMELARTELLREQGAAYRDLEASGVLFVVARLSVRYRRPAMYDDELDVWVQGEPVVGAKIEHRYEVRRGEEVLATGETTLVCVDREGKMQRVPEGLLP
ncbi:MAG: thioesterase family protein [Planctomycetota bacterium]